MEEYFLSICRRAHFPQAPIFFTAEFAFCYQALIVTFLAPQSVCAIHHHPVLYYIMDSQYHW